MAFLKTLSNTEKTLATIKLTNADGSDVPVLGLSITVADGDGTFSMLDNAGNPLPANQVYLISGTAASEVGVDTNFNIVISRGNGPDMLAVATLRVVAIPVPDPTVDITFGAAEPK